MVSVSRDGRMDAVGRRVPRTTTVSLDGYRQAYEYHRLKGLHTLRLGTLNTTLQYNAIPS